MSDLGWHALQHAATPCNTLQQLLQDCGCCCVMSDVGWSTLQHTAIHCNTLQHTATHCNTLQKLLQECCCACPYVTWLIRVTHDSFAREMMDFGFWISSTLFENRVSSWIAEIYRIFIFHNFSNAQRIDLICYWSTGGGLALWYLFHFVSSYFEKLPCGAAGGADLQSRDSVIHI